MNRDDVYGIGSQVKVTAIMQVVLECNAIVELSVVSHKVASSTFVLVLEI